MTLESSIYKIAQLPSHLAMVVFDEATGKMMEMRDLVRHQDPKNTETIETFRLQ